MRSHLQLAVTLVALLAVGAGASVVHGEPFHFAFTIANPTAALGDEFGSAVAIVGSNILVGADDDDTKGQDAGAVYLFDGATGALLHTFFSPRNDALDHFGGSLAVLGNNVLIGARYDDTAASQAGAAYLFDADPASPQFGSLLQTFLNPDPTTPRVGEAVALTSTRALLSTYQGNGIAHLFDVGTGTPIQSFNDPDPMPANPNTFGLSIGFLGADVLVSAISHDSEGAPNSGIAYLFNASDASLAQTFHNPTPESGDNFGWAVAGLGSNVLVSDPSDNTGANNAGAVYLFDPATGSLLRSYFSPLSPTGENFGASISVVGGRVLIGASGNGTTLRGAAYLVESATGDVAQKFLSPSQESNEGFGALVAASETRIVVSATANDTGAENSGVVYIFEANPTPTSTAIPTGTPTPTSTPTLTVTPPGPPPVLEAPELACQKQLATKAGVFGATLRKQLQKCFDLVLKATSAAKEIRGAVETCAKALDRDNPRSTIARASAKATAQILDKCQGLSPGDLDRPCDNGVSSIDETVECVLFQHAVAAQSMIAAEYGDACALITVAALVTSYPELCPRGF